MHDAVAYAITPGQPGLQIGKHLLHIGIVADVTCVILGCFQGGGDFLLAAHHLAATGQGSGEEENLKDFPAVAARA